MIPNTLPQSLIDHPRLNQWLAFMPGRRVKLLTGKVELGQGILTVLVQIAAEELDVAPDQIDLVSGSTGEAPNEGYTAGSLSTEISGGSIRLVCADARAVVLDVAAASLGCPRDELTIEGGSILRRGRETRLDYWTLGSRIDLAREVRAGAIAKSAAGLRLVGQNLPRRDLPEKLFGGGFIHDLVPGPLTHARMLRQPWRGAQLAELDEGRVRRAAGEPIEIFREGEVVAFLSASETAVVAAVATARERALWQGGERLEAEFAEAGWLETLPSVDRLVQAGAGDAAVRPSGRGGILRTRYSRPFLAHGSIGPSCALALHDGQRLTILTHAQGVFPLRGAIAQALGLPPEMVLVEHRPGAGCYGHNGADDAAFDAAILALRRPGEWVRVLWTREDELSAAPFGAAQVVTLEASLDRKGRLRSWSLDVLSPTHVARPGAAGRVNLLGAQALPGAPVDDDAIDFPDASGGGATRNAIALYDTEQTVRHRFVPRLPVRTSALRSLGAFTNVFAIESFVDELATAAGIDPVRYRLSLLADPRARRVVEEAAAMAAWSEAEPLGTGCAKGIAFSRYKNRAAYLALVVEAEVDEVVRLRRVWCAADAGLVVNPDGAINQIEGGIVQAASWTLKEQVRFADGRVASATWDSYPILRFPEVPEIEVRLVGDATDSMVGVGEAAAGPTAAAIGNAVARALGMRIRDLPMTRERLMAAALA